MSVDTILRVGRAAACVFRKKEDRRHEVIIGKDTRLSGYMFETALASGLCSMGVDVILIGPIPTPGIAFLTSEMRADAGIVISASHNPYQDNGIKFFGPDGFKLPDAMEDSIEQLVRSTEELDRFRPSSGQVGRARRLEDAKGRYITYLKHNFPQAVSLEGVRVVLDCAHGATYKLAPTIFEELGAAVAAVNVRPNGKNINEGCGALNPERLAKHVKEENADVGIAFDGDGDRVIFCDEHGRVFDGDEVLAILAGPMSKRKEIGGGVVGTVMSNLGLEKHFASLNIPFFRSAVGDRYVVEKMRETGARLGGEQSGHIVCLERSTTGDGILTALLVMGELRLQNKPLSAFASMIQRFPQLLINVKVREKRPLEQLPSVTKAIQAAETAFRDGGRVLVRYSGTELKLRVMVEGELDTEVRRWADEIAQAIRTEIGAS